MSGSIVVLSLLHLFALCSWSTLPGLSVPAALQGQCLTATSPPLLPTLDTPDACPRAMAHPSQQPPELL